MDRLVEPVFFGRFIAVKKKTTLKEYDLSENLIHLILIRQPKTRTKAHLSSVGLLS